MDSEKFKSCPFCGSKNPILREKIHTGLNTYYCECLICGAKGPWMFSQEKAEEHWNWRNPEK